MLGVMSDMDEERKIVITGAKRKKFRVRAEKFMVRVEQMNERELSVKPLAELTLKAEELDKELREKLSACFTHQL